MTLPFNLPTISDPEEETCDDTGAWTISSIPIDAAGNPIEPSSSPSEVILNFDSFEGTMMITTPDDGEGNYPGTSSSGEGGSFYYRIEGVLPEGTLQSVFDMQLDIDFCVDPTTFTPPSILA